MGNQDGVRAGVEARRAVAEHPESGRHTDAIAQYLTAFDYTERQLKKHRAEPHEPAAAGERDGDRHAERQ